MKFPSKSKLRDEKRRRKLEEMEREHHALALIEAERLKPVDAVVEAIERLIDAKQKNGEGQQEKADLKDALVAAIRSLQ